MAIEAPPAVDIAVLTDAQGIGALRALVRGLRAAGLQVHVYRRWSVEHGKELPPMQAVLVDVANEASHSLYAVPHALIDACRGAPLVLLVAPEAIDRILDLHQASDFIVLPGDVDQAVARVKWLVRRYRAREAVPEVIDLEGLRMDLTTHDLEIDGERVALTHREFELLKFLASHPRRVFSRSELLEAVWDGGAQGGTRTVDVHVRRLRAKLGPCAARYISTVRNVGYRFG